jgi:hypothetical protein
MAGCIVIEGTWTGTGMDSISSIAWPARPVVMDTPHFTDLEFEIRMTPPSATAMLAGVARRRMTETIWSRWAYC